MYRDNVDAMVAQIDALRRDLSAARADTERAAALERELADKTRELDRLRRRVGELPPRRTSRALLAAGAATAVLGAAYYTFAPPDDEAGRPALRGTPPGNGAAWFARVRARCNPLEVNTLMQHDKPPVASDAAGHGAACWALAGNTAKARELIDALGPGWRPQAAGVVFNVAHPVADAGDDRSAGPMMELVLAYWPENYQAMYHAGMAAYATGDPQLARRRLTDFRAAYHADDGFTRNAREVLRRLDGGAGQNPLERE